MKRDPRKDPKAEDRIEFRDKPSRTVKLVFTDACGNVWVNYTVTKQVRLEQWKRTTRWAEVDHVAE